VPPCDPLVLKQRLYDEFCVEIPTMTWNDKQYVRVSFQGYNTADDLETLMSALSEIFAQG
jgi:selenocysteine lyase/cysteine desulfurase